MEQDKMQESNAAPPPYQPSGNGQLSNQYPPVSGFGQPQGQPQPYQPPPGQQPYGHQQYTQQPYTQQPYAQQPYSQQQFAGASAASTVIVSQPGYGVAPGVAQIAPSNHAAMAWLTCLFCFWPLGIAAIVKSMEVDSAVRVGDTQRAIEASNSARKFSLLSIGLGIASYVLIVVVVILRVALVTSTYSYYN